jgi:hypothetical protein
MSSLTIIQNSLNGGELSPSLLGRTDLAKYGSACSTARNFFANYRGGVSSRAGLAYVGTCKQQYPVPPRDIPFQFSLNQGYVLEFGDHYMRIKSNGAYVTEAAKTVTSVNTSGLFTLSSHGYSVGDWLYDSGNTGFSGLTWIVHTATTNTFTVTDLFGNVITSAVASTGGTVARLYTVVAPYAAVDLPYLKYTQSADVMTLCCVNTSTSTEYPPYSLVRSGNTNWAFTAETFTANILPPTGASVTAQSSGVATTWYSYVVTAVNANTGEESVACLPVSVQNNDIALSLGSNTVSWQTVAGATSYNVYAATPSYNATVPVSSLFGYVGTALGPSYTDTNITADFTRVPPVHNDPFVRGAITSVVPTAAGVNYSPTTISYLVTSATGTGFSGVPVVTNGNLAGFVIYNKGVDYLPGDTIAFSDSGGGLAKGTITFTGNPADTNSMFIGGIAVHFATAPAPAPNSGGQFIYSERENTTALTVQTLANNLNSSNILSLSVATYVASGNLLLITYKTPGTAGNLYSMSTVSAPAAFSGATLSGGGTVGTGATATLTIGAELGTYPSVPAYFQERRVYASSLNQPDTYWMSQPGLFNNMDSSIPVTASDSITGTPWAQQVNGIQFLVPMPGGLVVLTGKGAWQVNGGGSAAITPSSQVATHQAYNGCNGFVQPIVVNYDIIYLQSKGSIFRDLSYNFFTNIYTGTDLTVLSSHLFTDYQMMQAAYAEEPYKLIWIVRDDGIMLALTYLKEQDVYSWTRHDTNGLFVGVCSVTEPPVDAIYVLTQRYVRGAWRYYSERMDNRIWNNVEDSFCVDAGLVYPEQDPNAVLNVSGTSGTQTFTASSGVFSTNSVGEIIRVGGGQATVTTYVSSTQVTGEFTTPITNTVPNDPGTMVIPAQPGTWSISAPTATVSGLNHLEGLTVAILADGSVVNNQVVTNGSITLPVAASKIVIGLPYICQAQTMYLEAPSKDGTTQNRRKLITSVGLRVEASRGVSIGADQPDSSAQQNYAPTTWTNMLEVKERSNSTTAGNAVPLFTGDYYKNISSGWDLRGQVAVQQIYPLPANILSTIAYVDIGDDQ